MQEGAGNEPMYDQDFNTIR